MVVSPRKMVPPDARSPRIACAVPGLRTDATDHVRLPPPADRYAVLQRAEREVNRLKLPYGTTIYRSPQVPPWYAGAGQVRQGTGYPLYIVKLGRVRSDLPAGYVKGTVALDAEEHP